MTPRPSLEHIEAVLLDLDGTLVETDNRWAADLGERLAPLRKVLPWVNTDALARSLVMSVEMPANYAVSIIEHLGLGKAIQGIGDHIRRSKGLATQKGSERVAGTDRLLRTLQGRYALAVVTTRARPEAHAFIEELGLSAYFPVVITRQDVFYMKPHPDPVLRAAEGLGIPPERCAMVGDTTMDVRAARRAGAFAVAVLSGFGSRKELERAKADLILDTAVELLAYLPGMEAESSAAPD